MFKKNIVAFCSLKLGEMPDIFILMRFERGARVIEEQVEFWLPSDVFLGARSGSD